MAKPKKKRTKKYVPNRRPNSILASLPVDKETQARLRGSIDEAMERLAASNATNGDLATILSVLEIAEPLVDGLEDPEAARTRLARGDELISSLIEGTVTQSAAAEGLKDAVVLAFEAVARAPRDDYFRAVAAMQRAHAEMRDNLRKEGRLPEIDLSEARAGASVWAMDAAEAYLRREAEKAEKAAEAPKATESGC
ncbi:hypothetical protein [Sutterella megalosphaeroides]|uniref:Uncharacterized protein n=1 Tax=Sutterella megalosphaeroides TaxID=2494234 RepID=A0A2Z6IAK9_9BURK|nr:hypothetical protein [Sutterella megalosphaeroides]BBF23469.1 hypothetical protein SUTMEG_13600 [Sutterella megalosphaeroides]